MGRPLPFPSVGEMFRRLALEVVAGGGGCEGRQARKAPEREGGGGGGVGVVRGVKVKEMETAREDPASGEATGEDREEEED